MLSSSSMESTLYTAPALRTTSVAAPVQFMHQASSSPLQLSTTPLEASAPLGSEVSNRPSVLGWSGLAALPLAALAGFAMGYWKPITQQHAQDPMEIVIDAGEPIAMAATTGPKTSLYAVVAIGGHQYVVQPGQILSIDKLPLEVGDQFTFDKVLLLKNGDNVEFGTPYLSDARVTAEVLRNSKGRRSAFSSTGRRSTPGSPVATGRSTLMSLSQKSPGPRCPPGWRP
eukprot:TRINITY_DN348_c0_g1_i7.p1 TRINITY_DN348_c0_g1~~TRINITY_DN348_c0_g1_i7.p1  ORF type:complete len:265 (-),score=7.40 TRINITY_DN348_c0_g1_i7:38-721(-)